MVLAVSFVANAGVINLDNGVCHLKLKGGTDWRKYADKVGRDDIGLTDRETDMLYMETASKTSDPNCFAQWKFTRSDASRNGVIEIAGLTEVISADGSWVLFNYGETEEQMEKQVINGTNLLQWRPNNSTVRFIIPKGAKTYYLRITNVGADGAWVCITTITAAADIKNLNAGNAIQIPCSSQSFVQDFSKDNVSYRTDSFFIDGRVQHSSTQGLFIAQGDDAAIGYKFKGTAEQIGKAYVQFTGSDVSSPDGSWFNIAILDSTGKQVYQNNITNLAGGGNKGAGEHTFAIMLKDIKELAGQTEFTVKFYGTCQAINNFVRLKYLQVGYELVGDINLDCKVDSKDTSVLAGEWLNAY